jgi:formiminoglutamase
MDERWPRAASLLDPACTDPEVVVVGVPTHATSISPTAADHTPDAIRAALARFSVQHAGGNLAGVRILDAGDIAEPDTDPVLVSDRIGELRSSGALVIALGGDNAATFGVAVGTLGGNLATAGLVTLDAHHDVRDGRSNGSPVRQLVEAGLSGARIAQVGISDFANSPEYVARARAFGITVISRADVRLRGIADAMREALDVAGAAGGPIHVDIDVDVCDRSVAPACPASVPGGISADELRQAAFAAGAHPQVVSVDITEVDAQADAPDQRTVRLAALCVLEVIAGFQRRDS